MSRIKKRVRRAWEVRNITEACERMRSDDETPITMEMAAMEMVEDIMNGGKMGKSRNLKKEDRAYV